jgi:hypothetical protein
MYQLHYALREDYFTRRKLDVISCVMLETETFMPAASARVLIDRTAHKKALLHTCPTVRNRLYNLNILKIHYTV